MIDACNAYHEKLPGDLFVDLPTWNFPPGAIQLRPYGRIMAEMRAIWVARHQAMEGTEVTAMTAHAMQATTTMKVTLIR